MNKKLYELDSYLNYFQIYDGDILDSKREQILNKGLRLGIPKNEIEDYIKLKIQQHINETADISSHQSDTKTKIEKCPSCNEIMPPLSNICASCGYVLKVGSDKELNLLIDNIETKLSQIKSLPIFTFFQTLSSRVYISLPILTIIICAIGFKFEIQAFALIGIVLVFLSWKVIKKKMREPKETSVNQQSFGSLKADFEKYSRTASTYFGENTKVKLLLEELKEELVKIEQNRSKAKIIEYIGYGLIVIALVIVLIVPGKNRAKDKMEMNNAEAPLIEQAEELIKIGKIAEARAIVIKVSQPENKILIQSKIQLKELCDKLDSLEPLLKKKDYSTLKFELSKLVWSKISQDYGTLSVERDVYKNFLQRKAALNNQLPTKYKIAIETEYSL